MDRQKNLEVALGQIEKQFGKGSVMRMGERGSMTIEAVSTGAPALDLALGIGGLPRGRVTEIYGPESSGKSTLALHVVAEAQRNGGICAYIDAEHALDPVYAGNIGVDIDELLISQPDTGEQALEIADMLVRSGAIDVVVIDSVAALTPRAEIEGDMGDSHVGLQARLMSQALRKLTANLNRSSTIAVFINQLREKIGVMFGSPETTPGGRALKFYSSVRLDIRRIESIKDGVEVVGNRTRVKVVKNKCFAAGTTVFDPVTGLTHRIEDVVERGVGGHVVAADKAGALHTRPILQRLDQGEAEVVGLHLRDGTALWVTPDHEVLTEGGYRRADELTVGDRIGRPRRFLGFGDAEPIPPAHARLLGRLIGAGEVDDAPPELRDDLCRWAGVDDPSAGEGLIPASLFAADVAEGVVANLLAGLWESQGHATPGPEGGVRVGFTTASEQLAHQIHWSLLRWGIGSSVHGPGAAGPGCEVLVSGSDDALRLAEALPARGPQGVALAAALSDPSVPAHRGSQRDDLPADGSEPVLAYLRGRGVSSGEAAALVGEGASDPQGDLSQALGGPRLRRDRLARLADALDSEFLRSVLAEDVWYDTVVAVSPAEWRPIYDVEVAEHHTLVADDVVAHNCAPPFKQAEFDIMYGKGISREGSLLDIAVDMSFVKKSGAWYTYDGEQLGQGRENAKQFLADNPEVMVEISERIRSELGIGTANGSSQKMTTADDQPISLDD